MFLQLRIAFDMVADEIVAERKPLETLNLRNKLDLIKILLDKVSDLCFNEVRKWEGERP